MEIVARTTPKSTKHKVQPVILTALQPRASRPIKPRVTSSCYPVRDNGNSRLFGDGVRTQRIRG